MILKICFSDLPISTNMWPSHDPRYAFESPSPGLHFPYHMAPFEAHPLYTGKSHAPKANAKWRMDFAGVCRCAISH